MFRTLLAAAVMAIFALGASPAIAQTGSASPAPQATPRTEYRATWDGKWHTTLTPYAFVPTINGSAHFTVPSIRPGDMGRPVDIAFNTPPSDYLSSFNFGFAFSGDFRKDAFSTYIDFMNVVATTNKAKVGAITGPLGNVELPYSASTSSHVAETIWEIAPGYSLAHGSDLNLDAIVGYRSAKITETVGWNLSGPIDLIPINGGASVTKTAGDFIVGARGNVYLSQRWYMPYYADIGWGSANTTVQEYAGFGYAGRTTDLLLTYRNLQYNGSQQIQLIRLTGPQFSVAFHW